MAIHEEITFKKSVNGKDVTQQIQYSDLFAFKQDIKDWQNARQFAISVDNPDWTDYIRVLNDVTVDSHITSIINSIKNKIKLKEFGVFDESGLNEDKTALLMDEWFYKFIDYVVESIFFPYTLVFLGDMKNYRLDIKQVEREYIIPQYDLIKKSLYITNNSPKAGWYYKGQQSKLEPYYIFIPSDHKLGLLDKVAYHALGKKHMLIYWWRYAEMFGIPWRIGKTDIEDNTRRTTMETMLKNSGNSQYAVLDLEDQIEFQESKNIDAYQVFEKNYHTSNNEISKAFAGAIGIFDEKSFVGSAEAGERIFDEYIESYCRKVVNYVNNQLKPRLIETYKFPLQHTDKFKFINKTKVTYDQKIEAAKALLPYYNIDEETIQQEFGIEVQPRGNATQVNSVMPEVAAMYKNIIKNQ